MSISIIKPYLKRLSNRKNKLLTAKIFEYKNSIRNELEKWDLFDSINQTVGNNDLIVFDYNKISKETEKKFEQQWGDLALHGWFIFKDGDENRIKVKDFRKRNKITSIMTILDGWIFFQKEDYSDRQTKPVVVQPQEEILEEPDWSGSHMKEQYLLTFANGPFFVETGTYLGQTVELVRLSKRHFREIYSIELNKELADKSIRYFAQKDPRIKIIHGDSVDVIRDLCKEHGFEEPITFWLDAHASGPLAGGKTGPCPLIDELKAIKETGRNDHTIFIDDRRLLGTAEWGGVQESEIMDLLKEINPNYNIFYLPGEKEEDIICATSIIHNVKAENGVAVSLGEIDPKLPDDINNYFGSRANPKTVQHWKEINKPKLLGIVQPNPQDDIVAKYADKVPIIGQKTDLKRGEFIILEDL